MIRKIRTIAVALVAAIVLVCVRAYLGRDKSGAGVSNAGLDRSGQQYRPGVRSSTPTVCACAIALVSAADLRGQGELRCTFVQLVRCNRHAVCRPVGDVPFDPPWQAETQFCTCHRVQVGPRARSERVQRYGRVHARHQRPIRCRARRQGVPMGATGGQIGATRQEPSVV